VHALKSSGFKPHFVMSCIHLSDGGAALGENRLPCSGWQPAAGARAPVDGAELQSIILISRAHVTVQPVDWQCIIVFRRLPRNHPNAHLSRYKHTVRARYLSVRVHTFRLSRQTNGSPIVGVVGGGGGDARNKSIIRGREGCRRRFSCVAVATFLMHCAG
jgi:hypothetical protein